MVFFRNAWNLLGYFVSILKHAKKWHSNAAGVGHSLPFAPHISAVKYTNFLKE